MSVPKNKLEQFSEEEKALIGEWIFEFIGDSRWKDIPLPRRYATLLAELGIECPHPPHNRKNLCRENHEPHEGRCGASRAWRCECCDTIVAALESQGGVK